MSSAPLSSIVIPVLRDEVPLGASVVAKDIDSIPPGLYSISISPWDAKVMKCPHCDFENLDSTFYCGKCGTKFGLSYQAPMTRTLRTPAKELLIGSTLAGKYSIIREIGRGGMGIVYKAEDLKLKRPVALKFLPTELLIDPEAEERFMIEAQAAAALSHPNICTIYEVGEAEGRSFIAMEFVEGKSLRERIKESPLKIDEFLGIAIQAAEGLEEAHKKGIIHRDIKSANIMKTSQGQAKIMDFGLAKLCGGTTLTRVGATLGTIAYMSPEQARGEKVDQRTDIWSLGVVFYELLTGELPFRGDRDASILYSVVHEEPRSFKDRKPPIPPELEQVIHQALRKDPQARYSSAAEMAKDLRRYQDALKAEMAGFFSLRSFLKRLRRPVVAIPAAIVLAAIVILAVMFFRRQAKIRWANDVALPEIERLLDQSDSKAVFRLALQAERIIPKSPKLAHIWPLVSGSISFETEPSGADVFIKDYADPKSDWEFMGKSPVTNFKSSQGYKHWKIGKAGYEAAEGAFLLGPGGTPKLRYVLDDKGKVPPGMVRVEGWNFRPNLAGLADVNPVKLGDYFLDKYEVTNRQYKEFVDSGAYQRRDNWKQAFMKNGTILSWEEAMKQFRDKTGRPGPATWLFGDFPEGHADYPVSGVSWYEAAAYAQFAGKSLPSVYHWNYASSERHVDSGFIVSSSNFLGRGPAAVGSYNSLGPFGTYDMAGNVKEWCWNETGGKRSSLGGAWNEQQYMFSDFDSYDPFWRGENVGFRCLQSIPGEESPPQTLGPLRGVPQPDYAQKKPCSDEAFEIYRNLYSYTKTDLEAKVESRVEWSDDTILEKVSFNGGSGEDRVLAYLFLPRKGKPPFQTVIHFPGSSAFSLRSVFDYVIVKNREVELYTKNGRAFILPVLDLTFDRQRQPKNPTPQSVRDGFIRRYRETGRCLDYLETRPELDKEKFACQGISSGVAMGAIFTALERRFKAAIFLGGGIYSSGNVLGQILFSEPLPEFDMINFAPRIKIPVLMQNGKYDHLIPVETNAKVLFGLLGTPEKDKSLLLYETGHSVWFLNEYRKDIFDFLDKHLGPVNR